MANTWAILATAAAGLAAGSFLNVVIHRGPALWGLVSDDPRARGSLWGPRSQCPHCRTPIAVRDLVPVLSYFALRGRCRTCAQAVSPRYPLVEVAGAGACLAALWTFGTTPAGVLAALFLLALIALAAIDHETGYLPEAITVPLIVTGLGANAFSIFVPPLEATIGAAAGFGAFWAIGAIYKRVRKRDGLGGGDAMLFAAIGAWGGWIILAPTALLAAIAALASVAAHSLFQRKAIEASAEIRFGPALCAAAAAAFLVSSRGAPWFA